MLGRLAKAAHTELQLLLRYESPDESDQPHPLENAVLPGLWCSVTGINLRMDEESQWLGETPGSRKVVPKYRYTMRKRVALISDPTPTLVSRKRYNLYPGNVLTR
eukprot:6208998-Pleurochrysis_carterae.AAC.2